MAPIKFEDDIREKLEERQVRPSANAWDKLSKRLDNQQEAKTRKPYLWLGLAASIAGVLLVVSPFFNNDTEVKKPIIVDAPEHIIKIELPENTFETEKVLKETKQVVAENNATKKIIEETKKPSKVKSENYANVALEEKTMVPKNIEPKHPPELPNKNLTFEAQKVQEVVAQIQLMKKENNAVTDKEIDALLAAALKEIQLNRLYNETNQMVDANALLQDVEAELGQSFRSKVFEALKSSYNSVKTAVAQRND